MTAWESLWSARDNVLLAPPAADADYLRDRLQEAVKVGASAMAELGDANVWPELRPVDLAARCRAGGLEISERDITDQIRMAERDLAAAAREREYAVVAAHEVDDGPPVEAYETGDAWEPPAEVPAPPAPDPLADVWQTLAEGGCDLMTRPPPREYLLTRDGDGALPMGVLGMLVAPGGTGKTMALCQLAVAVATGGTWLGAFCSRPGTVVLALAEEDRDEITRRLHCVAEALDLSQAERERVTHSVVAMGLRGRSTALVDVVGGMASTSSFHAAMFERIEKMAPALVVLDPLARWAPEAESDNALATRAVQAFEAFAMTPSRPAVLVAHHTAKWSRQAGNKGDTHDSRGVTGLTDGARWVATLSGDSDGTSVTLLVPKANYSPPMRAPVELVRRAGGALTPPTSIDRATARLAADARLDDVRQKVIAAVRAAGTITGRRSLYAAMRGTQKSDVDAAVIAAVADRQLDEKIGRRNATTWSAL